MDDITFNSIWRYCLAYGVFALLAFISVMSFSIPLTESVRPYFIIMIVYFWAIHRPMLIPPLVIFMVGIVYDLLMGFPLALHSVLFIVAYWLIKNQRLFFLGQSYLAIWIGFIITCSSLVSLEYFFFSALAQSFLNIKPLIGSLLLSVCIFPLLSFAFTKINGLLPYDHNIITHVD